MSSPDDNHDASSSSKSGSKRHLEDSSALSTSSDDSQLTTNNNNNYENDSDLSGQSQPTSEHANNVVQNGEYILHMINMKLHITVDLFLCNRHIL